MVPYMEQKQQQSESRRRRNRAGAIATGLVAAGVLVVAATSIVGGDRTAIPASPMAQTPAVPTVLTTSLAASATFPATEAPAS